MMLSKKTKHGNILSINAKVARNINRAIILNSIRERQPISRARISELTKLNKSTVSNIVATLIAEDLVIEEPDNRGAVGRSPINLRVKRGKHYVGAIYFDSSKTELAVIDMDGTIISKAEIKTEASDPSQFVALCIEKLNAMRRQSLPHLFRGIGITVAGIVDAASASGGTVVYAPNLGWHEVDLGQIVREHLPDIEIITVENDARASALAELLLGTHKITSANIVFLSVGAGIGAGIVVDNRILSGGTHAAGEFGHMTIVEGGEQCTCGNQGCWEVYASDRATVRRYAVTKKLSRDKTADLTLTSIIELSYRGDAIAREALTTSAQYIGLGIANIVRSFDPEVIIIGGTITRAWDLIYPEIMEAVNKRGFFGKERNTAILPTSLTAPPPLLGAAALSIRKIFTDYRIAL
ncbi:MAG: ROK family transcriptional regulator [Bacteroidota bacterium]|nr:ROK family transcriptional regulator [Bacteroidota bacterium]